MEPAVFVNERFWLCMVFVLLGYLSFWNAYVLYDKDSSGH